jgi:hypothetical protein
MIPPVECTTSPPTTVSSAEIDGMRSSGKEK